MTRRAVAEETKYYDFEIALTVDPIWCEEDEDGPRIDYRGDIRKIEEEDVVGRVRFFVFHFDTPPWDPADAFDHISETAVYAQLLDEHGDLSPQACKATASKCAQSTARHQTTLSWFRGFLGIGLDIGGHQNLDQNRVRSVGRILLEAAELSVAKGAA